MAIIRVKSANLLRRDTAANWNAKNPILREGEEGYETDTGRRKVGNGTTEWNNLKYDSGIVNQAYAPDSENAQSGKAVAEAVATEQKRANNTFSNALKGSKSGESLIIDDVSPVTHDMGVTVKRNNMFDYDSVSFKNSDIVWQPITIVKENNSFQFTNTDTGGSCYAYTENISEFGLMPNTTYTSKVIATLLDNGSSNLGQSGTMGLSLVLQTNTSYDSSGKGKLYIVNGQKNNYYKTPGTYELITTFTTPSDMTDYKYIVTRLANNTTIIFKDLQIELGTTATAYTPYVPDLTAVKVSRCGKNLFDINGFINLTGNSTYYGINDNGELYVKQSDFRDDTAIPTFITLGAGTYTLSSTTPITSNFKLINLTDNKIIAYNNNITFSIEKVTSLGIKCWQSANTVIGKLQLELGTTATEYEPYITPTEYTPTTDGTVNGVTSLYPTTTLMSDTDGVLIDCEYNRDINKAFAELQQAILSLGGNV